MWIKAAILVIISLMLSACMAMWGEEGRYGPFTPMPSWMRGLPQGSDSFSKGFRDGCYHMLGQNGYGMHRLYDNSPHPLSVHDKLYSNGYMHGDRYCSTYALKSTIL